ncbi:hypothetical protein [Halarchaeum sp. P4]|uniref:hypothetical protein n=1 Tax=Halarchaeum sp. P4 TaxID=3421639 RepID=UPI003EBF4C2A
MELPLEPTTTDDPATAALQAVDSQTLLERALRAAGVDADASQTRDHLIAALSPVERELVAKQVRYAAPQTSYYARLPGLAQLDPTTLVEHVTDSGFGVRLRAVDELFERHYLLCSTPPGGAQTQLAPAEADRHTTVATFDSGYDVLAVRAPTPESAVATSEKLAALGDTDAPERLDLRDPDRLTALEADLVHGYHRLILGVTQPTAQTDRIELTSDGARPGTDLRRDDVVQSLLERPDIRREAGRVTLDPASGDSHDRPLVDLRFSDGEISYRTPQPEATLLAVDRAIQSL